MFSLEIVLRETIRIEELTRIASFSLDAPLRAEHDTDDTFGWRCRVFKLMFHGGIFSVNVLFVLLYFVLAIAMPTANTPKQVLEMDGEQFGMNGKNYVLIYIADRRPVQLPSLSNEAEKAYFQRLAERDKAVDLARTILINGINSIENKKIEEMIKQNPEYVNRMISVLLGYAG